MERYKAKLRVRFAWWWVWWCVCALMFCATLWEVILLFIAMSNQSGNAGAIELVVKMIALLIFTIPTFNMVPSVNRLLSKDLKKESVCLYAKSVMLERAIHEKSKAAKARRSHEQIVRNIEAMEQQLKDDS